MMNEYLCRNFLADQILTEIIPQPLNGRDLDEEKPVIPVSMSLKHDLGNSGDIETIKENMLTDEGSSGYKNWLNRYTSKYDKNKKYYR